MGGLDGSRYRSLTRALFFVVLWSLATWLFEGRIHTLLRPDAVLDRLVYAFGVNLLLGIVGAILLIRSRVVECAQTCAQSGFGSGSRQLVAAVTGVALGAVAYVLQGAPSTDTTVVGNAFAQVYVVSVAEVVVIWALFGTAVEAYVRVTHPRLAVIAAAIAASVAFGLYHFAHSPPFDTWRMVGLLTVVGFATGAFFFVSRDVLGTTLFHNFLGTFGVVQALKATDRLQAFEHWQPPLIATATIALAVVLGGYILLRRRSARA